MRSEIPRTPVNILPEDREKKLLDALWILQNLRKYKKVWEIHFGSEHRKRLQTWEDKADKLLKEVGLNTDNDE